MKVPSLTWLVQDNLRDRAFLDELVRTLTELGEPLLRVPLVPFSPELPALPPEVEQGAVVCYGPSFVPRVVDRPAWRPGIFFDREAFRWSTMRAQWGELMLSEDGQVMSLADAVEMLAVAGSSGFVRPDADDKQFDGGVYEAEALRLASRRADRASQVIVAAPRAIDAEWRCFVIAGQVVDSSEYRRAGRPSQHRGAPPRVVDLAEQAAAHWMPAPVTCIDIGSSGDRFGVIEANCFNASRFYGVDTRGVLERVAAYVRGGGSARWSVT